MSITVEPIDDGIVRVQARGRPTVEEVLRALDEAAAYRSARRLWDLRDGFDLESDEVRRIALHGRAVSGVGRLALLAIDDVSYGMLRVLNVYRSEDGFQSRLFRSEAEALNWLRSGPT